jgi:8-oxo-dGTP pyrophosphatase MutT (NUDIX family)
MRALITEKLSQLSLAHSAATAGDLREAAVLLPLLERSAGITLLLTQRTEHLHHHPGQIGLPGGMIEAFDAGPVAAALREMQEEIGVAPDRVEVVGQLESIDTRTGFRITPIVGFVDPAARFKLDRFEVESIFEVPLDFLLEAGNYQRQSRNFAGAGEVRFYQLVHQDRIIWGATAQILVNFARCLGIAGIPD